MNNATYKKNDGKLQKQNQCKTSKQRIRLFKKYIKTKRCMSHKIFDNNLVAIRKIKPALKLNKPAYIAICF